MIYAKHGYILFASDSDTHNNDNNNACMKALRVKRRYTHGKRVELVIQMTLTASGQAQL